MDFIFTFGNDSEKRLQNLKSVISYYKKRFPNTNIIVSETGDSKTHLGISDITHIFEKTTPPHSQSRTINNGVNHSTAKSVCICDSDSLTLEYENISTLAELIDSNEIDYGIPYTEYLDFPNFTDRGCTEPECICGLFLVNREKFIEAGGQDESYEGWGGEDDERHYRLIRKGLRFFRIDGTVFHLEHPPQQDKSYYAKRNNQKMKHDISNPDKAQKNSLI